jgi:hypothetical protein
MFALFGYWEKLEHHESVVHQLFVYFKKAYVSVMREVLYNIIIEFGVPMNLFSLINMCLNETYIKVGIGDNFPIENGLKQGNRHYFSTSLPLGKSMEKPAGTEIKWDTSVADQC